MINKKKVFRQQMDGTGNFGVLGNIFDIKNQQGLVSKYDWMYDKKEDMYYAPELDEVTITANAIESPEIKAQLDYIKSNNINNNGVLDMSNGCINVNGESKCFDLLKKGSGVYILPEKTSDVIKVKKQTIQNGQSIFNSRIRIADVLRKANLPFDDKTVNFISSIHGKESKFGNSSVVGIQDNLSFFKSDGEFQINPQSFKKYLPNGYSPNFDNDVKAVYNFYKENKMSPDSLYGLYNTGKKKLAKRNVNEEFKKIYNHVQDNY